MSTSAADTPGTTAPGSGRAWAVPGYTEVRALGGGGFGEVVLAVHDAAGTPVAIKYLHPDLLRDAGQAAAFEAEARTLATLDSPYVVRLYEYVAGPAGAAIVMELVEGATLAKILERQGKTTPEAALVVLYGSLLGLAAAHAKGVVHRDYKPANVLVDGQGASKLTDFGIAALAGGRPEAAGTLRYMPPEQFEGAPASPAADVYAATVTFYQCLVGQVPFDGRTATELYDLHKSADVPMDPVPERLQPLIARGMAKDPRYRPADAARLAAELRDAAAFGYGEDWEDRGRSHLAEAALLLLALLWPSGSAPAAQGAAIAHTPLSEPPAQPASSASQAQASQPHAGQPQPGGSQPSPEARHEAHVHHAEHEEHLHAEHARHVEHEEHLARLRHEEHEEEEGGRQARPRKRPRLRARYVTAGAVVAAAAVIGVVAAFATAGHNSPPPPSGAPSPGVSTAGAPSPAGSSAPAAVPVFDVSFNMTRHVNSCSTGDSGGCPQEPLPLKLVCQAGGSCTASSAHWGATHPLTVNGDSMSFTGSDPGVIGACDGVTTVSTITMNITVLSWRVSGATRAPQQLTAQYTVSAPPTGSCAAWSWEATLTS